MKTRNGQFMLSAFRRSDGEALFTREVLAAAEGTPADSPPLPDEPPAEGLGAGVLLLAPGRLSAFGRTIWTSECRMMNAE